MNTNELADELEKVTCVYYDQETNQYSEEEGMSEIAATMLRHLQNENEALKVHPAELTDEEILQVMINVYSDTVPPIRGVEFSRAILRKAQEKC